MSERNQKEKPGTVLLDLDGTMAHYAGWGDGKIGHLLPGVKESVAKLRDEGHKVLVWTARGAGDDVRAWLAKHEIEVDGFFPVEKPIDLVLIIDDRALRAENRGLDPERVVGSVRPAWKDHATESAG